MDNKIAKYFIQSNRSVQLYVKEIHSVIRVVKCQGPLYFPSPRLVQIGGSAIRIRPNPIPAPASRRSMDGLYRLHSSRVRISLTSKESKEVMEKPMENQQGW